jgi:hypothetical protein
MTPNAVPYPAVASEPVLQCVMTFTPFPGKAFDKIAVAP